MYLFTFLLLVCSSFQQQVVFNQNRGLIQPFTYEWVHLLEQFHNAFGNTSKKDVCLYPLPRFECKQFVWDDAIVDRDAYHLRPQVKKERNIKKNRYL